MGMNIGLNPANSFSVLSYYAYLFEAIRRQVLFMEVMRIRGNNFNARSKEGQSLVLATGFHHEIIMDGRDFARPVNHALVKITDRREIDRRTDEPVDASLEFDESREGSDRRSHMPISKEELALLRPIVIIDPRAGHGPGIGGSKHASQIGLALDYGHPVYFITFFTDPVPGQTTPDVVAAEIKFLEKIMELHPGASKPAVIGNCQAGWAAALFASMRPDLVGPLEFNGTPMSFWAGIPGTVPMRFKGGLGGGIWPALLLSDLNGNILDGANIVKQFEGLNWANSLWSKQYRLLADIENEEERYLKFEEWWGGFFKMTKAEIDFIGSQLFIGNRLERGEIVIDGVRIDLRNLPGPIFINCSDGDNITPTAQALGWILAIYKSLTKIDKVIIYCVDKKIGHLGIFTSSDFVIRNHNEYVAGLEVWENLPHGLYQLEFTGEYRTLPDGSTASDEYGRKYPVYTITKKTLEDLRVLCATEDDRVFAKSAQVSELLAGAYTGMVSPFVTAMASPILTELLHHAHPKRLERTLCSDNNPLFWPIAQLAPLAKEIEPLAKDNPFLVMEGTAAQIVAMTIQTTQTWIESYLGLWFTAVYSD